MSRSFFSRLHRRFGNMSSGDERRHEVHALWSDISEKTQNIGLPKALDGKTPHVIIIGAGFAGLSAAYHLTQGGYKVTVIEARGRVGGRVHSLRDFANNQTIEAGAELIGTNHQLWMWFARKFGLSFDTVTPDDLFNGAGLHEPLIIDGIDIDGALAKKLHHAMNILMDKLTHLSREVDPSSPWECECALEWDNTPLSDWIERETSMLDIDLDLRALVRKAMDLEFANNNAVPTKQQSFLAVLAMIAGGKGKKYWEMSEVFRCSNGNDEIAKAICNQIQTTGGTVLLNSAVSQIDIEKSRVIVKVKPDSNEQTYVGDLVILAVPPSTWHLIQVTPAIPRNYQCQMGVAIKYLSSLRERFWVKDSLAPSATIDGLGLTWEGSDSQSIISGKDQELTVFSGGETASLILKMKEEERDAYYRDALDRAFKKQYSPNLRQAKLMSWPTEPWTLAGYSFPNVGEVCSKIRALNDVFEKRMLFAGEHTCMAFVGYMEGALQSGLHAALKIDKMANAGLLV